jgi:hypothetical protein
MRDLFQSFLTNIRLHFPGGKGMPLRKDLFNFFKRTPLRLTLVVSPRLEVKGLNPPLGNKITHE